jgi:pimeloyl-ACP methyl ester carboxylesterase
MICDFLTLPDRRLAYQRLIGDPQRPGVIFLGGYASDMSGTKASFLAESCAKAGFSYLRFDYRGTGQSSGDFKQATLGDWLEDTCAVFDQLTKGNQIVIGSSMGGWLAFMLALQRPERARALIGIAAAPDFTEALVRKTLTPDQEAKLEAEGFIVDPTAPPDFPVIITKKFMDEARQHLLLNQPININCPVHLLQGKADHDVPWQYALAIMEKLSSENKSLIFVDDGDHRLSRPQDLDLLWQIVLGIA